MLYSDDGLRAELPDLGRTGTCGSQLPSRLEQIGESLSQDYEELQQFGATQSSGGCGKSEKCLLFQ